MSLNNSRTQRMRGGKRLNTGLDLNLSISDSKYLSEASSHHPFSPMPNLALDEYLSTRGTEGAGNLSIISARK